MFNPTWHSGLFSSLTPLVFTPSVRCLVPGNSSPRWRCINGRNWPGSKPCAVCECTCGGGPLAASLCGVSSVFAVVFFGCRAAGCSFKSHGQLCRDQLITMSASALGAGSTDVQQAPRRNRREGAPGSVDAGGIAGDVVRMTPQELRLARRLARQLARYCARRWSRVCAPLWRLRFSPTRLMHLMWCVPAPAGGLFLTP